MDCRTARLLLSYHRPHAAELDATDRRALEGHLATCPECEALARAERLFDERLGPAVRSVAVPAGLRGRLRARLDADRAVHQRRWLLRRAAVAAAILLAAVLGLHWFIRPPAQVNLELALAEAVEQRAASPEAVEQWFGRQGVKMRAPEQFNYGLLAFYQLVEFAGEKQVPQLVFLQTTALGPAEARVYVLSAKKFALASLAEQARLSSGGCTVEVRWDDPEDPQFAYLVIYRGESLEPFLSRDQPPPLG
jgi:hypothetical protein